MVHLFRNKGVDGEEARGGRARKEGGPQRPGDCNGRGNAAGSPRRVRGWCRARRPRTRRLAAMRCSRRAAQGSRVRVAAAAAAAAAVAEAGSTRDPPSPPASPRTYLVLPPSTRPLSSAPPLPRWCFSPLTSAPTCAGCPAVGRALSRPGAAAVSPETSAAGRASGPRKGRRARPPEEAGEGGPGCGARAPTSLSLPVGPRASGVASSQ